MAFHTACPITSRRICYCELGFRGGLKERGAREEFLEEAFRVEEFLIDPWILRDDGGGGTVDVRVPCVLPLPASPEAETEAEAAAEDEEEAPAVAVEGKVTPWALTLKARREAFQQQAAAASQAAEDYARRLESGMAAVNVSGEVDNSLVQEDEDSSTTKVICRICFSGEKEGSERAMKMLCCKMCNKKYHRSCLKIWAEYRDLFNWSSWACPSCRVCEVCQRTDDPTKLMYCKRCDNAYHCYCQQPPHKNISHGPFLCPKHTRCHSCGSTVSGSGHSTRWFLSFTCCDACGRLFVKGKYCPVCLKVYRDSEMTPMVCCDVCQQWVHCVCDGISDEKYQQFQKDGNLYYKCAACRRECYKVKDMDDAVRELWRRKDKADCNLTARLRSAAGLPNHEDTFSKYPFSDDDESGSLLLKSNHEGSLNFSGKGFGDKSSKEYGKNFLHMSSPSTKYGKKGHRLKSSVNPEEPYQNTEKQHKPKSLKSGYKDKKSTQGKSSKSDGKGTCLAPNIRSPGSCREKRLVEPETSSTVKEGVVNNVKVHSGKETQSLHLEESVHKNVGNNESAKGTKLVILLGAKNRKTTSSPRFEASSCRREQDFSTVNGARLDRQTATTSSEHEARENNVAEARKFSDMHRKRTNMSEEGKHSAVHRSPLILQKRSEKFEVVLPLKQSVGSPTNFQSQNHDICGPNPSDVFDDPKPLLKLKFKKPYFDKRSSWASQSVQEKNSVKGQRSKRKRPSLEKLAGFQEDGTFSQPPQQESVDEVLDANWILQKLGEGAVGKRVEVHQSSDDTWHLGVVSDVIEGSSSLSVHLDDGRPVNLELGKQGVRFIAQKQEKDQQPFNRNRGGNGYILSFST